jgi:16S rRNA (guanine527-N7)-methyltransferase
VSILTQGLSELNIPWENRHIEKIRTFLAELSLWNKKKRFVDASGKSLIINHVLDSLSALPLLLRSEPGSLADIGSGGGFPGILLSIFLEETRVTLVERSSKKSAFLKVVSAELGLSNLDVFCGPAEQLRSSFSVVTARACTRIDRIIQTFIGMIEEEGFILLYKGKSETIQDEMSRVDLGDRHWEKKSVHVPFLDRERHLVVIY